MNVTWSFATTPGATNPSFSGRAILDAMGRIQRYWAVNFVQVARSPSMSIVLTNRVRDASWAAWTSGRTIYIPSAFKYNSYQQLVFVLVHEMGHVFGGGSHARQPGHVMSPSIADPYLNFTQTDYAWFRLPVRPATQVPRAWDEPNHWRPVRMPMHEQVTLHPTRCGHGNWSEWFASFFEAKEVQRV